MHWTSKNVVSLPMLRTSQLATGLYAFGLGCLGLLSVIYRDFAYGWQPVPDFHPGRQALAVACGLYLVAVSVALPMPATSRLAVRFLFPFLLAWLCLKVPALIVASGIEGVWLGFGELGMLMAGGWALFARLAGLERLRFFSPITGPRGIRLARIFFGLSVIPVGLSHLFYLAITANLVPSWLPFRSALGLGTGVAQMLCGVALVFSVFPRLAALVETGLLLLFAFLVWGPQTWWASKPGMAGSPAGPRFPLTAFLITWIIGASALLIATITPEEATRPENDSVAALNYLRSDSAS